MAQAAELIEVLKTRSPQDIASLMSLSDKLAGLNVARYQAWQPQAPADTKPAVLTFNGDVYDGLDANTLDADSLAWAQDHVCILSGLYGLLRPMDALQPYRLEMGTKLPNPGGKDLYAFWGRRITDALNQRLARSDSAVLLNLASEEYFKSVQAKALKGRLLHCAFEDFKGGRYKIISFYAKRARGLMARWMIDHRVSNPDDLRAFDAQGYAWDAQASSADRLVFRRRLEA
jgi:cytoplasmic iron level regulating protein YaaA (DUF328/UPF0246 family)